MLARAFSHSVSVLSLLIRYFPGRNIAQIHLYKHEILLCYFQLLHLTHTLQIVYINI